MNNLLTISKQTIKGHLSYKSFYLLLALALLFILGVFGIYSSDFLVKKLESGQVEISWNFVKFSFHLIAFASYLTSGLLAMRLITRDLKDGSTTLYNSRSVKRWEYLFGRILGVVAISTAFMFLLHLLIFVLLWINSSTPVFTYLLASLVTSVNLIFVILLVVLLTLYLNDIVALLLSAGIVFIGFIIDAIYLASKTELVRAIIKIENESRGFIGTIYPKLYVFQSKIISLILNTNFEVTELLMAFANLFVYITIIGFLLLRKFSKKELL